MQRNGRKQGEVDWVAAQLAGARRTRAALIDALMRGECVSGEEVPLRPCAVVALRNTAPSDENRPTG